MTAATPASPPSDNRPAKNIRLRPFAAAHWSLLVLLCAAWTALLAAETCAPPPYYGKAALAAATVCVALWCNHLAIAPLRGPAALLRLAARSLYDLAALVLLVLAAVIAWSFGSPMVDCATDRSRFSEMVLSITPVKTAVTERALAAGTLAHSGRDLRIGRSASGPEVLIGGGLVTEDGVIVLVGEKPAGAMMFTPALKDGKVEWTCIGFPQLRMPAYCREVPPS